MYVKNNIYRNVKTVSLPWFLAHPNASGVEANKEFV